MKVASVDASNKLAKLNLIKLGRYLCNRFAPRQIPSISKFRDWCILVILLLIISNFVY